MIPRAKNNERNVRNVIELLRDGRRRLVQMHTRRGLKWFVVPGGEVTYETAKALLAHPHIQPSHDGLFPGINQTFRFKNNAR